MSVTSHYILLLLFIYFIRFFLIYVEKIPTSGMRCGTSRSTSSDYILFRQRIKDPSFLKYGALFRQRIEVLLNQDLAPKFK